MMEAAQALGHEVWITEVHQLSVIEGKAYGILSQVQLIPVSLKTENGSACLSGILCLLGN